jgi:hypothetical protein
MTFQERFTEACSTQNFKPYKLIQGPDAGYLVWEDQQVRNGQQVTIDGPYFTEEDARVSADLMRGTFRSARASDAIYNRVRNHDPRHEQLTIDQAHMPRIESSRPHRLRVMQNKTIQNTRHSTRTTNEATSNYFCNDAS